VAIGAAAIGIIGGMTACTSDSNDPGAKTGAGGAQGGAGGIAVGTGTGGTTGTGGATTANTVCAGSVKIAAANPGIADFDAWDGVSDINKWSAPLGGNTTSGVYDGPFGYGDRASGFPETFEMTTGHASTYALRIADTLAMNYGGGMGTWLSACLNATAFQGISFWVRGNSPMSKATLTMFMQETLPSAPVKTTDPIGTCPGATASCIHPSFPFNVTDTWTQIQVPWASFTPGNAAGTPVTPDGRNITQIQFGVALIWGPDASNTYVPMPAPYELVIDTLTFY